MATMVWRNTMRLLLIVLFSVISNAAFAAGSDMCNATALMDVQESEDTAPMKKGELIDAVSQYNVDKATGKAYLCSHGGGCYLSKVKQNGQLVDTLKLNNCEIDLATPSDEGDHISYGINVIRSKFSAKELQEDDLSNRFIELGLCWVCASNLATLYVEQPKAKCTLLAKAALEGNPDALETLQSWPAYCPQ